MVFKKKKVKKKQKFCPICGTILDIDDAYCTTCGYSFHHRNKKRKRAIKWKNIIIATIIILLLMFIFYFQGNPDSLLNWLQNQTSSLP